MGVLNSFLLGDGEFAHQKNCPGVLPGGMVRLGIDRYIMYPKTGFPYFDTLTPVIVKLWVLCAELREHAELLRTTK